MCKPDLIHISGVNYESMVDGRGIRATIFVSGCPHHCHGCHNPSTWFPDAGRPATDDLIQKIADGINGRPFIQGITISGGDPLMFPDLTNVFLDKLLPLIHVKNVWMYTGYTWEELCDQMDGGDNSLCLVLSHVDVLVDGRFDEAKADRTLQFRGSSNQRIIDVKSTINAKDRR